MGVFISDIYGGEVFGNASQQYWNATGSGTGANVGVTVNALAVGLGNITYGLNTIYCGRGEELMVSMGSNQTTALNYRTRFQFSGDNTNWAPYCVETNGAPSGGIVRKTMNILEIDWAAIEANQLANGDTQGAIIINIPVIMPWFRIGMYLDSGSVAGANVFQYNVAIL